MKFKRFIAGLLAVATVALNTSTTIIAEETANADDPADQQSVTAENSTSEETEENEETEVEYASTDGDMGADGIIRYDPEYRFYRDQNGNAYLPKDQILVEKDDATTIPSKYDTRTVFKNKGLTFPEIKDQNPTGSCWAHGALAACEINGILKGLVSPTNCNFSEAHLNYFSLISDKNTSSDYYGDTAFEFTEPSAGDGYYGIYNRGGNDVMAASVLSRGSGPIYERSEWDIGYAPDNTVVIIDNSGSYESIYDKVPFSSLKKNTLGYYYYVKNGKTITLNGKPYSYSPNTKNNLYFTPIDEQYRYRNEYSLLNTYNYSYNYSTSNLSSINNVKEAIMENGCLTISYYASGTTSSKHGYYFPRKAFAAIFSGVTSTTKLPSNHEISVIGWDDNYSKDNFYCDKTTYKIGNTTFNAADLRPQKNGAWLCRNSWGEEYGDEGYFYLSYEEPEIISIYSYELGNANTYGENTYRNVGVISGTGYVFKNGYSAANIFTAKATESISAVSLFTYDNDVDYTVKIYTSVTANSPISGTLAATVSGTLENGGYHTIDLKTPISITKGQRFSVVYNTTDTACMLDTYNKSSGISYLSSSKSAPTSAYYKDTYYNKDGSFNVFVNALTSSSKCFLEQPKDVTVIGGTKFKLTASARAKSMEWQYNNGSGWKKLSSGLSVNVSNGIMTSTAKVSSSLSYKNCTFRCVASDSSGNSVTSNTVKLSFYSESSVTVSMVKALDSTDLVNYVNYFTKLYTGNFVLTPAQLKAIELVLAADYAA